MSRSPSQDPGAVLSSLRPSLRLWRRAWSLRSLPPPSSVLPPRAGGVAIPRRCPPLPARSEVSGPPSNRVGPRPSRGAFVGRRGRAPRGLRGDSRSPLSRPETGARLQPGGVGRACRGPRGARTAPFSSAEKNEGTAAADRVIRGRSPSERGIGVPRSLALLLAGYDASPRRRRAHDRRNGGSGRASAPRRGSGSGRRSHPRAGSLTR